MITAAPPSSAPTQSFRERVKGPPIDKSKAEHVGATSEMGPGEQSQVPKTPEPPTEDEKAVEEALSESGSPQGEQEPTEGEPQKRLSVEETMNLLQEEGFQVTRPSENSAQPTTPDDMTTPPATSKPPLLPPDERGRLRPSALEGHGKFSWWKAWWKWIVGITLAVPIIIIAVNIFTSGDDDVQLSEVVNNLADQKAGLEKDKTELLAKLGESEARASAVEELKAELAVVRKLAEKPIDISTLLAQPLGTARVEEIKNGDKALTEKSALSVIVSAAVNTLVFEEIPVTVNGVEGVMTLAFDEDGVGVIQFTPKTSAEAPAPTEQ